MIINSIQLINFRNYKKENFNFNKGINFLYGNNGSGKTSIVEAIFYFSIGKSFRTNFDDVVINDKFNESSLKIEIENNISKKNAEIIFNKNSKRINVNNKKINKLSELNKLLNCLYFIPEDVNLLKNSPKDRRFFLNINIAKENPLYLNYLSNYEKLLKERNLVLKEENPNIELINVLTNRLIKEAKEIYYYRKEYLKKINDKIKPLYEQISGLNNSIKIKYKPLIDDYENYAQIAEEKYKENLENDLIKKTTSIGVHKEDFSVYINGKDIGIYGSQGENRIATLCLKLVPYELIEDEDKKPIIILDDVFSELDDNHQNNLINYIKTKNQIFITSTSKIEIDDCKYFHINDGELLKGE